MVNKFLIGTALAGALALSGCTTGMEQTGDNTKTGAATGAIIGGLFGATRGGGDNLAKGVVGAAIGAAIGGAIGQQLDKQAQDLRSDLGNSDVKVVNTGNELVVTMPQDILFATDSATLREGLKSDLRALAYNLQDYPNTTIDIIGHTDNVGSATYNEQLSTRRAQAVGDLIISQGVPSRRVRAYGLGEDRPIANNLTAEGRAQNRRVEIIIRPIQ